MKPQLSHLHRAVRLVTLALLATPAMLPAQSGAGANQPYRVVETGRYYARLQDAINAIGNRRATIQISSGRWADCGVQEAGDITYAAAVPGRTIFMQSVCEGKAMLVLRGAGARVTGITFANLHVSDGNGAGIRLEKGNLTASQDWFRDSDEGILTGDDPASSIAIDTSTFSRLGRCGGNTGCAHGVYAGFYGSVSVTRSRFEGGNGGHYLKSRAARILAENNVFDDTNGHATNYMIDLCAGASGRIANNWFVQGAHKENASALITVAAESHDHSANGLVITGNVARLAPGAQPSVFVADWSGDRLVIGPNRLDGGLTPFQRR